LADCGVDEEFIKALDDLLQPGKAVLLLRHEIAVPPEINNEIARRLAPLDGSALPTSLNPAMEHRLRQALRHAHNHRPAHKLMKDADVGSR